MTHKPSVLYWHLWTGADGISRQQQRAITHFDLKSIQPPAAPQWQSERSHGAMTVLVTVLPVGWEGTWHENPKPQWIIPLSGQWFVESMDGTRAEMGTGELSFGADQNCREVHGKRGHRSGTVGDIPAVLMLVQLDDATASVAPRGFG
jgi:hypothetical protein